MSTIYRYEGGLAFRPINGGPNVVFSASDSGDLGTVGNRPAVLTKPNETNTGARYPTTQTMTGAQALAAVLAAPVEGDGFRYLRRTLITSTVTFTDPVVHSALRFEDCVFPYGGAYRVNGDYATGSPPAVFPEFRYCTIEGGSTSTIQGMAVRYLRCNLFHGNDIVKCRGTGGEFYACYIHDNMKPVDGHCDSFQIRSSSTDVLIHWNNCVNINSLESVESPGEPGNGVLQTGSVTGNIGPVYWYDNWFNGGGYTIRVGDTTDLAGYSRTYVFQRNKFGRTFRFGPTLGLNGPASAGVTFDSSNVWEDTGLPVN